MSRHFKLSPSGAERWLRCPGSLTIDTGEDHESSYAAEGTAAHQLAHRCWMLGVEAETFIGQEIYGHEVTEEMAQAVQLYLDTVDSIRVELGASTDDVHFELTIYPQLFDDFGGTIDCLIVGELTCAIVDLKYGIGVVVEAENNSQLMCYALLAADYLSFPGYDNIKLTVVQPRANHDDGPVRSWTPDAEQLHFLADKVRAVSIEPETKFHAGDHCRWCPAKSGCPELYQLTLKTAQEEFDESQMTPGRAAEILSLRKAISSFLDATEQWAHGQMDKGRPVPGYKLVNTFGQRRYCVNEDEIIKRCRTKKFGKKQIFETKLRSPAQLEKVVGKELVSSLCERPLNGTTVVPESDKRPAVERKSAAEEFASEV